MRRARVVRDVLVAVGAAAVAGLFGGVPASAAANVDSTVSGGATFDVSASIAGRYADPAGVWVNPCEEPFVWSSRRLADDAGVRAERRTRADGVIEYLWQVKCEDPETFQLSLVNEFWVSAPTPGDIVADLAEILPGYLDPPVVSWPNSSPDHGWLFVRVPMDFRISNLGAVSVSASVTNAMGTVSASATATPSVAVFSSGEGGGTECPFDAATLEYVPRSPGVCSYTYANSSAIAGGTFESMTTVRWEITSTPTDPSIPPSLDTFAGQALAVSEVQAVVTCQGSGC